MQEYSFAYCENIRSLSIPKNVTKIEPFTFYFIRNLQTVEILGYVISFGTGSFDNCNSLISMNIPNSTTKIDYYAFESCNFTHFEFPEKVTDISTQVLRFCYQLKSVVFRVNVTKINSLALTSCYNLQEIKIPENVTFLGSEAFLGCKSLPTIVIPRNVINIKDECFRHCSSLKAVYFLGKNNPSFEIDIFTDTKITY